MAYETLKKLYYRDKEAYEAAYQERFASPYAHHVDCSVGNYPAFFVVTPEIVEQVVAIQKADKRAIQLYNALPGVAIRQFSQRCLIDEIVLTNNIEGVQSTRREIGDILSSLEQQDKRDRFRGLVQKYAMLGSGETLPLKTCQDVRRIYDDLVLSEVLHDDPKNGPDGEIFRAGPVSVLSAAQKTLHHGLYPEAAIVAAMDKALAYLNDEREELLYRTAVFHYLLGYIHPFYDGNGRLNRFISSYMLSRELTPVLGYRLSYTIKEHIGKYYEAFKLCNEPLNRGDLTPFVAMFLTILENSVSVLAEALETRWNQLKHYRDVIIILPYAQDAVFGALYYVLIQAALFSEDGVSTQELLDGLGVSKNTLHAKLVAVEQLGLLAVKRVKNRKFYTLDLPALDALSEQTKNG